MSALTPAHRLYEGDAGRHYHEGKRALDAGALEWVVRARAQLFAGHIRPEHTVLEYGVGAGWNLLGLQCRRRVGIDVQCFLAPGWESRGIEFFPTTASSMPGGDFDVILCHHALEHVESPAATLTELLRLAKPGGRLLLAVPYESERRYRRHDPNEPNHHLYSWNVQSLGNLVTLCGWTLESVGLRRYGYDRFAANVACRKRLGETGFRALRRLLQLVKPCREIALVARRAAQSGL